MSEPHFDGPNPPFTDWEPGTPVLRTSYQDFSATVPHVILPGGDENQAAGLPEKQASGENDQTPQALRPPALPTSGQSIGVVFLRLELFQRPFDFKPQGDYALFLARRSQRREGRVFVAIGVLIGH